MNSNTLSNLNKIHACYFASKDGAHIQAAGSRNFINTQHSKCANTLLLQVFSKLEAFASCSLLSTDHDMPHQTPCISGFTP